MAKILVVDDHIANMEFLKKLLEDWSYEVISASRGLQALKLAQEVKPDLVLLDIVLPDVTGYEVCRALKVYPETHDTMVIFLTAKGEIFDRVEGLDMGAHDYIAKPFHPEELRARVKMALKHKEEKDRLRQEAQQLKALSIIDETTGFYNRRYFEERLSEEFARAKRYNYPLSVALVSPDGFDDIRKLYSPARGDKIIKQMGDIMKRNIRAIDIVTRYSDGEFAVILPQTDQEGAAVFGEKVRKVVSRHLFYGIPDKSNVTCSIGIASFEQESLGDVKTLMEETEKAQYTARTSGGNKTVVFEV